MRGRRNRGRRRRRRRRAPGNYGRRGQGRLADAVTHARDVDAAAAVAAAAAAATASDAHTREVWTHLKDSASCNYGSSGAAIGDASNHRSMLLLLLRLPDVLHG